MLNDPAMKEKRIGQLRYHLASISSRVEPEFMKRSLEELIEEIEALPTKELEETNA